MLPRDTAFETVEVLQNRLEFVESLSDQPMEKRELVESLDTSRSTVDRATRELETAGLIEYSEGRYELTSLGRATTTEFDDVLDSIRLRQWLEPFLRWIPEAEFEVELDWFREGDLLVSEPGDPYAMINRHVELLKGLKDGWFLLPFTGLHATEVGYESIVHDNASAEFVVNSSVAETFRSNSEYISIIEEMVATGRVSIFSYGGKLPFALNKINDTVQIISADGDKPRALVETRDERAMEWAEEVYQNYKQDSEQLAI